MKNRCALTTQNYCIAFYFPSLYCQIVNKNMGSHPCQISGPRNHSPLPWDLLHTHAQIPYQIDTIYSSNNDGKSAKPNGEMLIEWAPSTSELTLITFVDVSSLYVDK